MKNTTRIAILFLLVGFVVGCRTTSDPQTKIAGNYSYNTQCVGIEGDGTQTLKAWGSGRNRSDAFEQACKNAVYDVLFKGIKDGKSECEMKPLAPELNARQKHETYFNIFFTDGGEYKKYISMDDEHTKYKGEREKKNGTGSDTYSTIVIVKRPQLKEKLIQDGIISK
jgi:hypothetical protein